jgi:hypothetical protein
MTYYLLMYRHSGGLSIGDVLHPTRESAENVITQYKILCCKQHIKPLPVEVRELPVIGPVGAM